MYYSSGNYEAFARPVKPEGVDDKSAYIVGSGLAALAAACFLVRDGQMKGEHVHVLEKDPIPGGACDGYLYENLGYVMRGGREMDNHFECMWDLFHSIPSIETEGVSVLDEYYWRVAVIEIMPKNLVFNGFLIYALKVLLILGEIRKILSLCRKDSPLHLPAC